MSYLDKNLKYWNRKYDSENVESFVFRLKSKILNKYIKPKKKLKILDFGCGEGASLNYFISKFKYDGYGVDISQESIKTAKKKINNRKLKLITGKSNSNDDFFNVKFDLIISIQVLYYLNNDDLQKRLRSFNKMLKPNGYVFFTMISTKNKYFKEFSNKTVDKQGLTLISLNKNKKYLNEYKKRHPNGDKIHYINFTKSLIDLKKKFNIFKPLQIGFYDGSLNSIKDSGHHYTFFGRKK